ncbi:MAG: hypothetical protein K8S27_13615 [Candidatus Omnitrophica bacterium]|nr:hypothetical protein [Candidatus Omnitrophota bacterium]
MDIFANATPLENAFWVCALGGTFFFMIRFVLMMVSGAGGEAEGLDGAEADGGGFDTDATFQFISIHTLTAFVMMFGWAGLTAYRQFLLSAGLSIFIAFLTGGLFMYLTAFLLKALKGLSSRGGTFNIRDSIGLRANVYQMIPADGRGRIHIAREGTNTVELDAVSHDKNEISSFKTVEIMEVVDGKTVSVKIIS